MDTSHLTPAQRSSVEYEGSNLFIEAGAGTGKTATLTAKVAYLMERENAIAFSRICELLAITFTNKAAGELTGRIRSMLRSEGLTEEALLVDGAWISTIHGMCERMLKDHAFELDIDPSFEVADAREVAELRKRAIVDAIVGNGDLRSDDRYDALFDEYDAQSKTGFSTVPNVAELLGTLIERIVVLPHGVDDLFMGPAPMEARDLVARLLPEARAAFEALQGIDDPNDGTVEGIKRGERILELLAEAETAVDPDEVRALLGRVFEIDPMASGRNQGGKQVKEVVSSYHEVSAWAAAEFRQIVAWPLITLLCDLAVSVNERYGEFKRVRRLLDNNDLLSILYHAFETHPEIVGEYADQFRMAMIDEFQDTDSLQVGIANALTGNEHWKGQLVTVGDAQQSIYGFRGAEPGLFHAFGAALPDGSDREMLDTNFRSHPDILAFVNRVFGAPQVFGEHYLRLGAPSSRSDAPLEGGIPRIDVLVTTSRQNSAWYHQGLSSEERATIEATAIARRFRAFADTGEWDASQMVVLLGRMTNSQIYANALRAEGFEAVVTGGSLFWTSPEAVLVGNILRSLANPLDNEAVLGMLSSPMLRLSSDELAQLAYSSDGHKRTLYEGLRSFLDDTPTDAEAADDKPAETPIRIKFAAQLFSRALEDARTGVPSKVVEQMLADSGYIARLEARGTVGNAECGNVRKALRAIEGIEKKVLPGIAQVARAYSDLMADAPADAPGALIAEGQKAVRIMTIHASKGLEFPIVALAEFDGDKKVSGSGLVMRSVEGRTMASLAPYHSCERFAKDKVRVDDGREGVIRAEDFDSPLLTRGAYHRLLVDYGKQEETAERRRLFYVGATRAREALIVAVHPIHDKDGVIKLSPILEDIARVFPVRDADGNPVLPLGNCEADYGGTQPLRYTCWDFERTEDGQIPFDRCPEVAPALPPSGETHVELPELTEPQRPVYLDRIQRSATDGACEFSYTSLAKSGVMPVEMPDIVEMTELPIHLAVRQDEDSGDATMLGSAFHRVAEGMVVLGCLFDGEVVAPSAERITKLTAPYQLTEGQQARLHAALATWVDSDIAREAASWAHLRAEAPFHVRFEAGSDSPGIGTPGTGIAVPCDHPAQRTGDSGTAIPVPGVPRHYLEGAIDLLCTDDEGKTALIVDYKTGGSPTETPEHLHQKHLLQAMCYALAVFVSGIESVELAFVRVEQVAANGQPQVVRYRFTREDEPAIRAQIVQGLAASIEGGVEE